MTGALQLAADTKAVLCADAGMFLLAQLLGVWKYRRIATSESHTAHVYVDIAHRVALFYSLVVAEIGGWLVLTAGFLDRQIF